jgi:response regulator RpfG family c-di-GMP phosphodiesterase
VQIPERQDKAKILLVDDREENLVALEAILSSLDQELVRARSGEEALKALLTDEYAVILLDIVMPGMDGFETAQDIKRRRKTRDVPIIFLTAVNSDPDYAFRGYAAGAVDFIAKPFDPWVLRAKVSVFVELYNKTRQLYEQAALLRNQSAVLGSTLTAVEAQAYTIAEQASDELKSAVGELERRILALRAAIDGLRPSVQPRFDSVGGE